MNKKRFVKGKVFFLNPKTCGIYKSGGTRYKVDADGKRTRIIDNELLEHVETFVAGQNPNGAVVVPGSKALDGVLVPRYFDKRWHSAFDELKARIGFEETTIGDLLDSGVLSLRGGHGSPGNDQRVGEIPYVKVSDIRNLRININPTNLIPFSLAKKFWRSPGGESGLHAWDLITPNRASSNIGEFALLLPGEEQIVLTKEVFIFRVAGGKEEGWDPFYLLWCFCLKAVRDQWQRVTLMQTNREDVGERYREIRVPKPISRKWAAEVSNSFRNYFQTVAASRAAFQTALKADAFTYIASVFSDQPDATPEVVEADASSGEPTEVDAPA